MADKTDGYRGDAERLLRRRYDRSDFLRLVGAGATLPFIPASLAGLGARPSEAQTTPSPEILSEAGEYPIGAWSPPPPAPAEITTARYEEIAAAGFNFVIGGNGATGNDDHPLTLAAAEAAGLRFLLTDNILQNAVNGEVSPDRRDAVKERIERLWDDYRSRPALAGFNLYDEPHRRLFGILEYAKGQLQRLAPEKLPYVNVWPSYASSGALGVSTYAEYLNRYFDEVSPPVLSFDHYPLLTRQPYLTPNYFYNWAVIRQYSLARGVPSWGFIQSVGFEGSQVGLADRRVPTEREVFWQISVSLAYGAKGIQYFTYWTPTDSQTRFRPALIGPDGNPTSLYYSAQRANEYLGKIGRELLPLASESVVHAGERRVPYGTRAFRPDGYISAVSGSPVILSRFRNPAGGADRHLLVVNRYSHQGAQARLAVSSHVKGVSLFDRTTGGFVSKPLWRARPKKRKKKRRRRPYYYFGASIAPGEAQLYLLRTG